MHTIRVTNTSLFVDQFFLVPGTAASANGFGKKNNYRTAVYKEKINKIFWRIAARVVKTFFFLKLYLQIFTGKSLLANKLD